MTRKMQNTAIPWIGSIPCEWKLIRIKNTSWLKGRIGWDGLQSKEFVDNGPYLITGTDFFNGKVNWSSCVHITKERYDEDELLHIKEGDLLITKDGTIGKLAIVENCPNEVSLNSGVMIIRNNSEFSYDNRYMYYVLSSDEFWLWFNINQKPNSTIQHLYQHQFGEFKFAYPLISEQMAIARYLDNKCDDINNSISRHQQIIEKLEEYRKSVITQAVTKGLDPNAEMKDSGNHLLGNIPADWVMKRLRNVAAIVRGGSPRPIDQYITDGDGYNWIKIGDATGNGKYITSTKQKIIKEGLSKTRIVNPGTLLLTNSMSFGHPYILQITGCIHDGWLAFSDYREMIPEYLYYYLMAEPTMVQFKSSVDGSVVQNLNIDKVKNAIIVCPSLTEQKAIVSYLDTVGGQVDESIKKHAEIIEKLKEYKQSIIYNAVTGKIDCRVTE